MSTDVGQRILALERRLQDAKTEREQIDAANELAWELRDGDPDRSTSLCEDSYRRSSSGEFEKEPYARGLIMSLRGLAHASRRSGQFEAALSQSLQALEGLKTVTLPAVEVDILRNTAIILGSLANYPEALEYGFRALRIAESLHDRAREGLVLGSIGVLHLYSKNYTESESVLRKALALHRELGYPREEGLALNNLSLASRALGDLDAALESSLEGLRLAEETGFKALTVTAAGTVAEIYLARHDYENTAAYLETYLARALSSGSKRDESWAHILQGELELEQNRLGEATQELVRGLAIAREVGLRLEESRCHDRLATVYERAGKVGRALEHLKMFIEVRESIFTEAGARSMAHLRVLHNVETARKDAEINYLRTVQLQKEVEAHKMAESALELLASTDPLTGVLNRRKLFALGEDAVRTALRDGEKLSAILVDVDHFKVINDTYGHGSGDAALMGVAQIIRACLRRGEVLGRIGGDEFAVLLPDSDTTQATGIARRIHETLSSQSFRFDGLEVSVEASFGVAQFDRDADSGIDSLLNHADLAMYSAKKSGRNRVAMFRAVRRASG